MQKEIRTVCYDDDCHLFTAVQPFALLLGIMR